MLHKIEVQTTVNDERYAFEFTIRIPMGLINVAMLNSRIQQAVLDAKEAPGHISLQLDTLREIVREIESKGKPHEQY